MYRRILVPLENGPTDRVILDHVRELSKFCGSEMVLIHVADGVVARNLQRLKLRESEEMRRDRKYLDGLVTQLEAEGLKAEAILAAGDPADEILAAADREKCDLIAMGTHGHKFFMDLMSGSVARDVRHKAVVPVLLVRAVKSK